MLRAFAAVVCLLSLPALARADDAAITPPVRPESGHIALALGAFGSGEPGSTSFAPNGRAEVAFNVVGPVAAGGYFEAQLGAQDRFALGGGLLFTLRPDVPGFPVQPHLELSAGRLQVPGLQQAMLDVWTVSLGGGLGVPVVRDVSIEARVRHTWLVDLPTSQPSAAEGWTVALAVAFDLR